MINLYKTNPHLKKVVKQAEYQTLGSMMFLYWLVKNINPKHILEFGTGFGCSAIFMALGAERGTIVTVDDYRGDTANSLGEPEKNIVACGVVDKIRLIAGNTKDTWLKHWTKEMPEIVFMDASHYAVDLQGEYSTLKNVIPKDHILVIDDVFAQDVYSFVNELSKMKQYKACSILKLHYGVAVLHTNMDKYFEKVNNAIREAYYHE